MNRDTVSWQGYIAAAPTPFSPEGEIDYEAFGNVLDYLIDHGAHGLVINGSTGEWFAQDHAERHEVVAFAIKRTAKRVPLIAGISALKQDESIGYGRHACEQGADGVLLSPPPASRLTDDELFGHFETICSSIALPVMAYNIPADGVPNLSPAVIERLAGIDNIVAVKDNPADELEFYETIRRVQKDIRVFGSLLNPVGCALIASGYGGDGYIGSGMPLGPDQARFFEALWAGDSTTAEAIAERFVTMMSQMAECQLGGMHALTKAIMTASGCYAGVPRPPRQPLVDAKSVKTIQSILRDAGMSVQVAGTE